MKWFEVYREYSFVLRKPWHTTLWIFIICKFFFIKLELLIFLSWLPLNAKIKLSSKFSKIDLNLWKSLQRLQNHIAGKKLVRWIKFSAQFPFSTRFLKQLWFNNKNKKRREKNAASMGLGPMGPPREVAGRASASARAPRARRGSSLGDLALFFALSF